MAPGEHDGDEFISRHRPAPADRTWQHPSEFGAARRQAKRRADRRVLAVGAVSAITGALFVGLAWYLSDPGSDVRVVTQLVTAVPVESVAPRVTSADDWAGTVAQEALAATAVVASADGVEALAGAIAVHDDGYLLTSARALGEATDVLVQTHDGRTMTAVVIGHDHETDLSVLKADGLIKPAMVGGSPAVDGDVVAVVDPTGPAQRRTVTGDVASSIAVDGDPLVGLVGLDGARDELPAGSPVLDATGAVVGIVTATDPAAKVTVVPITVANAVAEDIIAAGRARKAWLGVSAGTDGERVVITAITPDSPAAQAGLAVDDLVAAIDDRSIDTPAAMVAALRGHAPGDEIPVTIERDGVATAVEVVLGSVDD